jgi:hypothetical protein
VRKFYGWVTSVRPGTQQVQVTASGPWHFLERIGLTGDVLDGTGVSAERPLYAAPTQNLATTLAAVADRAISAGLAPMRRAAVASIYSIPSATLAEQSVASAIATLLAWCPDAICWFDYADTTGNALPILNFGRRADFAETTLTYGTDAIESADLAPRLDLEVQRVEISYVTRRVGDGKPQWAADTAGSHIAGKRQLIAVSGPEVTEYLPKDDFESHVVSSIAFNTSGWLSLDAEYQTAAAKNGALNTSGTHTLTDIVQFWNGAQTVSHTSQNAVGNLKTDGSNVAAGWYFLSAGAPMPDWLVTAWAAFEVIVRRVHLAKEPGWASGAPKGESALFRWCRSQSGAEAWGTEYHAANNPSAWRYCMRPFEVRGWAIPYALTAYTQYKPWEYDYLTPPANLATNLRAAQAWVPWEGPLTLVADDCDGSNILPRRYHIANGYPAQAAMGAMARAVEHDLMRGRTTIDLGAPARLDYGSLVSKIRRDPKDNIVWL